MQNSTGTGAYPFRCLFIQASSIKAETKRRKLGLPENMCPAFHQQLAATDGVMPEDHMLLREKMVTTKPQPAAPAFLSPEWPLPAPVRPSAGDGSCRGLSAQYEETFRGSIFAHPWVGQQSVWLAASGSQTLFLRAEAHTHFTVRQPRTGTGPARRSGRKNDTLKQRKTH